MKKFLLALLTAATAAALLCEKLDPWDLEDYGCQPELEQLRQLMDTLET